MTILFFPFLLFAILVLHFQRKSSDTSFSYCQAFILVDISRREHSLSPAHFIRSIISSRYTTIHPVNPRRFFALTSSSSSVLTSLFVSPSSSSYSPGHSSSNASSTQSNSSNTTSSFTSVDTKIPKPRTGWNHNLPGPNSSFWSTTIPTSLSINTTDISTNTTSNRPKTGWLHYPSSPPMNKKNKHDNNTAAHTKTHLPTVSNNIIQEKQPPQKQQQQQDSTIYSTISSSPIPSRELLKQQDMNPFSSSSSWTNHRLMAAPVLHPCGDGKNVALITEHCISVPLYYTTSTTTADKQQEEQEQEPMDQDSSHRISPDRKSLYTRIHTHSSSVSNSSSSSSSSNSNRSSIHNHSDTSNHDNENDDVDMEEDIHLIHHHHHSHRIELFFTIVEPAPASSSHCISQLIHNYSTYTSQQAAQLYKDHIHSSNSDDPLHCLLFLQGGPGFGAPIPISTIGLSEKSSWLGQVLFGSGAMYFNRVILMDSRGTGRSTTITKQTLEKQFPNLFLLDSIVAEKNAGERHVTSFTTPSEKPIADELDYWEERYPDITSKVGVAIGQAAEYMSQFRADNIVRDAELLKEVLFSKSGMNYMEKDIKKVSTHIPAYGGVLGQSYGGFCICTYLSLIEKPPKMCLFTGGIPPIFTPIQEVYSSLWTRIKERNRLFYQRYPGDIPLVKRIVRRLKDRPETLPSGGLLTARRFLQLGISLGGSPSAFASLHSLLSTAFVSSNSNENDFTRSFLKCMDSLQPFDDHPVYYLLHESIYADGSRHSNPTSWAAHKVFQKMIEESPKFNYEVTSIQDQKDITTLFFGEVVFPWMCEGDYAELSDFGMRALAHALADKNDWEKLYNEDRIKKALTTKNGISKAVAAVYYDDMYVDFDASMKVVKELDDLVHVWITNDYQHSGIRDDGAFIIGKLIGMLTGSVGTPS